MSYAVPAATIWEAITGKEAMQKWYFDIKDFKPEVGCIFSFYEPGGANKYLHQCEIIAVVPFQQLQYTWSYPHQSKGKTLVSWNILAEGNATKVVLTHEGLETFADAGDAFTRENFETGWKEILSTSLKNYLENS